MPTGPIDRSKQQLRAAALAGRDALDSEYRAAASEAIARRGLPADTTRGLVVAGYAPIRSEIDPSPLMRELAAQGVSLALPVIVAPGLPLLFRAFSPGDRLTPGPLGIPQPSPDARQVVPDVVLLPLAAFDRSGHRIGYGAGYYDRTLTQLRGIKKIVAIGLAFAVQEIAAAGSLPHDAAMDFVLTEAEMIDFRS